MEHSSSVLVDHSWSTAVNLVFPTLLRAPGQHGRPHLELIIPGEPQRYSVVEMPSGFFTVRDACGQWIYFGAGPIEVVRSPAPF